MCHAITIINHKHPDKFDVMSKLGNCWSSQSAKQISALSCQAAKISVLGRPMGCSPSSGAAFFSDIKISEIEMERIKDDQSNLSLPKHHKNISQNDLGHIMKYHLLQVFELMTGIQCVGSF